MGRLEKSSVDYECHVDTTENIIMIISEFKTYDNIRIFHDFRSQNNSYTTVRVQYTVYMFYSNFPLAISTTFSSVH